MAKVDPTGLWDKEVHYDKTREWAEAVGFARRAATQIAKHNHGTDGWIYGRPPIPYYGDQDYHFNGHRTGPADTRLEISAAYMATAKELATRSVGTPWNLHLPNIAKHVGIALHAEQDFVAHGDYFYRVPKDQKIWNVHNKLSPQREFGDPGKYPDDPTLDVVGSPDGRPTIPYLMRIQTRRWYGRKVDDDYACYEKGTKRITETERRTRAILEDFKAFLIQQGRPDVTNYFLDRTQ